MTMKLTQIDIQQQQFRRELRGFSRQEVQSFLDAVGQQIGELSRENNELKGDLRRINRDVEDYRERESTLKEAMLTAQRAIEEIREQAQKEAQLVVTEAEVRAEKIIQNAHGRMTKILSEIRDLKRQKVRAVEELRGVLNTHMKLVDTYEDEEPGADANVMVFDRLRAPQPPSLKEDTSIAEAFR